MKAHADRLIEVFHEAKILPAGAAREDFLAMACGEDRELRERVALLLQADASAGDFLNHTPLGQDAAVVTEGPGDVVGRYKLVEKIGEGGCGVVYLAEQERPVRRRVGLKIIKLGMDTRQVVARFEAERQALAMMDHPNIARVFDAGATDTGRPFFVMELVPGVKITDYCDEHQLAPEERLHLFNLVCSAIQHAHQKGVIHRDIKPSNILVAETEGAPVPKVIDFGIAKATEGRLSDMTVHTELHQFLGTPAYMSPEQADLSALDLDTRSDIYSLGVLLYELLTGKTPFDTATLLAPGLDEMRRMVRETEPPKPSTRLSTLAEPDLARVAVRRRTDSPKLLHLVRGDLDWIVMKCLEKDRTRRYQTANGLAADVQRHLNNEPVTARPPSNLYRLRKLARRNRLAVGAAAAVSIALVLGIAASSWQAVRASRAEQAQILLRKEAEAEKKRAQIEELRSRQVAQFMQGMLHGVGPSVALGRDTAMLRDILDKTAEGLDELKGQPAVEADLRVTIGDVYSDLGEYPKAVAMYRKAIDLRKDLLGDEHAEVAVLLNKLGNTVAKLGQPLEAEAMHRDALAMRTRLFGGSHLDVAESLSSLAMLLREQRRFWEAEAASRQALEICVKVLGEEHANVAAALHVLAWNVHSSGRNSEAEALSRRELAIWKKLLGNDHPNVGWALGDLTIFLLNQGKLSEAEATIREALEIGRKQSGNDPAAAATFLRQLGFVLHRQARHGEAESVRRDELAIRRNIFGNDHPEVAATLHSLAASLHDQEKPSEAEAAIREALRIRRARLGADHFETIASVHALAGQLRARGALTEVEDLYRVELAGRRERFGGANRELVNALDSLADVLREQDKFAEALPLRREALDLEKMLSGEEHLLVGNALLELGVALCDTGHLTEAEAVLRQAIDVRTKLLGEEDIGLANPLMWLGSTLSLQNRHADAGDAFQQALAIRRKVLGNEHPDAVSALRFLADSRWDQQAFAEVEPLDRELLASYERTDPVGPDALKVANRLGTALHRKGRLDEAQAVFVSKIAALKATDGAEGNHYLGTLLHHGADVLLDRKLLGEARALAEEAVNLYRKNPDWAAMEQIHARRVLAAILEELGDYAGSEPVLQEIVADFRRQPKTGGEELAGSLARLANTSLRLRKFTEAESQVRECLRLRQEDPLKDLQTFHARHLLGESLLGQKKYAEAETLLRETLAMRDSRFKNDHAVVLACVKTMASVLQAQGHLAELEVFFRAEWSNLQAVLPAESFDLENRVWNGTSHVGLEAGYILHHLADVLRERKALHEARSFAEKACILYEHYPGWPAEERAHAERVLVSILTELGDYSALASIQQRVIDAMRAKSPANDPNLAAALAALTQTLLLGKKFAEAELPARECLAIREETLPDDWRTFNTRSMLGGSLLGQQKYAEAGPLLLSGYEGMKQREQTMSPVAKPRIIEALERLAHFYEASGLSGQAAEWNTKLAEFTNAQLEAKAPGAIK